MNRPETNTINIPIASPYYDRLRSLHIQMESVPYGSLEYHYLDEQIAEMERRARLRMNMIQIQNNDNKHENK